MIILSFIRKIINRKNYKFYPFSFLTCSQFYVGGASYDPGYSLHLIVEALVILLSDNVNWMSFFFFKKTLLLSYI